MVTKPEPLGADEPVVVVGAGQAGASFAFRLRRNGHRGPVWLVGDEPLPPYQRPPLSKKYLTGEIGEERLFLKSLAAYEAAGIVLLTAAPVASIDRGARTVLFADGHPPLGYGRLVLATGARTRDLPPEVCSPGLSNVTGFRGLGDARGLMPLMRSGARLLVVGGGFIGLETAAVGRKLGLEVTVLEQASRVLNRVVAPETADRFAALHREHGVGVMTGVGLARIEASDGLGRRAILTDGTAVDFDLAVVGIGAIANDDLARNAGLACNRGIVVDAWSRGNDPAIHAIGDCATIDWNGEATRFESVQNAIAQGEHLADALTGATGSAYIPMPWFWSDQYDMKLQIAGFNRGYDRLVARPGRREGSESFWYFAKDRLLAVDALNDQRAFMQARAWLSGLAEGGPSPDPALIADPAYDPLPPASSSSCGVASH